MSKQSDAKTMQGWGKEPMCCKTCQNCIAIKTPLERYPGYFRVKYRCDVGGFACTPMNSCHRWDLKK